MSYIKFANVYLKNSEKNILDDASFNIQKGDVCLIVSEYLSGISNIIATDTNSFTGVVMVDDKLLNTFNKNDKTEYLKKIAHVHPDNDLIQNLTVYENICLACEKVGRIDKVKYYLNKLGLSKKSDLYPLQLKSFDVQKVKLAMMLCKSPSIILYTGIDLLQKNQCINILKVLIGESKKNKTTVIIESKKNELAKAVNMVVTIKNGEVKVKRNKKPKKAGDLK